MTDDIRFPSTIPDYIADADRENPAVGQHGVRATMVKLCRDQASNHAMDRAKETDPSLRAIHMTREKMFDEIGDILAKFAPPWSNETPEELAARILGAEGLTNG